MSLESKSFGLRLTGKRIMVTGASSGVGYAVARRLAMNEGATVIAVGRRRMFRIEALARQITEQYGEERLIPITADMAANGQAQSVIDDMRAKYGRIDGFLHAVNRALRLTALEVNDQEFDMTMQVNVKSALYAVQALASLFREQQGGTIVIYNPTPTPTPTFAASEAVYAAAAQALAALAEGWKRQLEPHGVKVHEVAPMPLGESNTGDEGTHDELVLDSLCQLLTENTPLPRLAETRLPWSADTSSSIVLSRLGGLSLTQFSQV